MDELTFEDSCKIEEFSQEETCMRFKQFMSLVKPDIDKLADEVRSMASKIEKFENGEILPDIQTMFIMNKLYGLNINWLYTGEGNMFDEKRRAFKSRC
jgi:transcriptional regulator with XRE-family HTH domain